MNYPDLETKVYDLEALLGQYIIENRRMQRAIRDENFQMKEDTKQMKEDTKQMKEDNKLEHKKMNKQWGALANKMGTIVEDIIIPSMNSLIKKYFKIEIQESATHVNKKIKSIGIQGEYDIIAQGSNTVFVIEIKSTPDKEKLIDFKNKSLPKFIKLFPQYKDYTIVPIFGGINIEKEVIYEATKQKIFTIAYREWDYVDILNFKELKNIYL